MTYSRWRQLFEKEEQKERKKAPKKWSTERKKKGRRKLQSRRKSTKGELVGGDLRERTG